MSGAEVSTGWVASLLSKAAGLVEDSLNLIRALLILGHVLHADEHDLRRTRTVPDRRRPTDAGAAEPENPSRPTGQTIFTVDTRRRPARVPRPSRTPARPTCSFHDAHCSMTSLTALCGGRAIVIKI